MTYHTLQQIIDAPAGTKPWFDYFNSLARRLKANESDVANLSVGASPGFAAAYDTRFYVTESAFASNAYTAATSPAATGEALPTGYAIIFVPTNGNTGAATLDVGSTDGAVAIKKYESGAKADLASGDLVASKPVRMVFDGTHWVAEIAAASGFSYAEITAGAALSVGNAYVYEGGNGADTFTLPALSGLSAGDRVRLSIGGTAAKVTLNRHANDDSGSTIWIGAAVGDFIDLEVLDVAATKSWHVRDHRETILVRAILTSNETVAQGATEQLINLSASVDTASIWDSANDEVDVPLDAYMDLAFNIHESTGGGLVATAKINTTLIKDSSNANGTNTKIHDHHLTLRGRSVSAADTVELWAQEQHTDGGDTTIFGDAAGDKTFAEFAFSWRY